MRFAFRRARQPSNWRTIHLRMEVLYGPKRNATAEARSTRRPNAEKIRQPFLWHGRPARAGCAASTGESPVPQRRCLTLSLPDFFSAFVLRAFPRLRGCIQSPMTQTAKMCRNVPFRRGHEMRKTNPISRDRSQRSAGPGVPEIACANVRGRDAPECSIARRGCAAHKKVRAGRRVPHGVRPARLV